MGNKKIRLKSWIQISLEEETVALSDRIIG